MLQKAADHRAHADVVGHARHAGRQHAGAAHDQVDLRAGLAGRAPARAISASSVSALILTTMRAGAPGARRLRPPASMLRQHAAGAA